MLIKLSKLWPGSKCSASQSPLFGIDTISKSLLGFNALCKAIGRSFIFPRAWRVSPGLGGVKAMATHKVNNIEMIR